VQKANVFSQWLENRLQLDDFEPFHKMATK
jgi:hypothetical protein